jgi:hypothetical protein
VAVFTYYLEHVPREGSEAPPVPGSMVGILMLQVYRDMESGMVRKIESKLTYLGSGQVIPQPWVLVEAPENIDEPAMAAAITAHKIASQQGVEVGEMTKEVCEEERSRGINFASILQDRTAIKRVYAFILRSKKN